MAFYLQYRDLSKRVKRQLDELNGSEKGTSEKPQPHSQSSSRLSGDTERPQEGEQSKSSETDQDGDKDSLEGLERIEDKDSPYARMDGISVQKDNDGKKYYQVDWTHAEDPQNPHNWSSKQRWVQTLLLVAIAFVVTAASSVDSGVQVAAAKHFGVSQVVEALGGTGVFLAAFGVGSLVVSPASELFGRYPVYLGTLFVFGMWLIGAALAPNIGAQIVFRGLAGFFASAPLTVSGGTMSDLWTIKEKTVVFPMFALVGFGGPVLGPVISSYMTVTGVLNFRWAEWIMLITDGLIIFLVIAFQRETLGPKLLMYKAKHIRKLTGDDRFKTQMEATGGSILETLKTSFTRPFILAIEPIILAFTFYLTVIYIVLFTFLDGYPYIFEMTYKINPGLSNLCFIGLFVGILSSVLTVPFVRKLTYAQLERAGDDGSGSSLRQEMRLIYSMIGAPLIPIGLFWMGWTDRIYINIWSPLMASTVIGFGIVTIFMSAYMYIIDAYEIYAASALTFVALVRYLAAGGMTVVGVPMYENLGVQYTTTVLGAISAAVVPIPYVLWFYGPKVRSWSNYAAGDDK